MKPTPETDAVWDKKENILDHARKLERERDEALKSCSAESIDILQESINLRKVADAVKECSELSDSALRLRFGEMTAQEIRTVRAVLNQLRPEMFEL